MTKRVPGKKRGRPRLTPDVDPDAELLADIMVRVSRVRDPDWSGEGWSSSLRAAIRAALEARHNCIIPASPTPDDKVIGKNGAPVFVQSRINDLGNRINAMEPGFHAFNQDNFDKAGRVFAMAEVRRRMFYARQRLEEPMSSAALQSDFSMAIQLAQVATHHLDVAGVDQLRSYIDEATRRLKLPRGMRRAMLPQAITGCAPQY